MRWEDRDQIDPEQAQKLIFFARDILDRVNKAESVKHRQALLQVMGYPITNDERELDLVVKTIRKVAFPLRSGGIY
jgi:hypothetical protein